MELNASIAIQQTTTVNNATKIILKNAVLANLAIILTRILRCVTLVPISVRYASVVLPVKDVLMAILYPRILISRPASLASLLA